MSDTNNILDLITKSQLLIDKYSPKSYDDLILNPITRKKLQNFIKKPTTCIFIGSSGSGKTITSKILGKNFLQQEFSKKILLNLNASDDRGLNLINNIIIPFIQKKINDYPYKVIIINEANSLTSKAQTQISYLLEKYPNCKFIFISSELNNISDTIQSRCSTLYFPLLTNFYIFNKLKDINIKENIGLDDDVINSLTLIIQRDLRQGINCLQVIKYLEKPITSDKIYELLDKPNIIMIEKLLINLKDKNKLETLKIIKKFKDKGYTPNDILLAILNFIMNYNDLNIPKDFLIKVYNITSKYYIRINQGSETWIQVYGCLSTIFLQL